MVSDAKMIVNHMNGGVFAAGRVEFAGLAAAPNWQRADVLREHLVAMFPTLPRPISADNIRVWLGHRPSMPDGRPCIARHEKLPT